MEEKLTIIKTGKTNKHYFKVFNDKVYKDGTQEVSTYDVSLSFSCTCKGNTIHPDKPCKHIKEVLKSFM